MRLKLVTLLVGVLATACAAGSGTPDRVGRPTSTTRSNASIPLRHVVPPPTIGSPPAVVVRGGGRTLQLRPYTFCWGGVCADGVPSPHPDEIGNPRVVTVKLPGPDWIVDANFTAAGQRCTRRFSTTATTDATGVARIVPRGPAGAYDVDLFVRPPTGGDLAVRFRWVTPTDGPANEPKAVASVLADHDGAVDSYGVEFSLSDLRSTPDTIAASLTVTASNGASTTMDVTPSEDPCPADGSLAFRGPLELGRAAAELGSPPFTYVVDLTMDGLHYSGRAEWPTDVDPECSPCVPIRFTPRLPRFESP